MIVSAFKFPIQASTGETETPVYIREEADLNPMASVTLDIWYFTVKQLQIGKATGRHKWIAFDDKFMPGKFDIRYWAKKGITAMRTIIKKGETKSFQEIRTYIKCILS